MRRRRRWCRSCRRCRTRLVHPVGKRHLLPRREATPAQWRACERESRDARGMRSTVEYTPSLYSFGRRPACSSTGSYSSGSEMAFIFASRRHVRCSTESEPRLPGRVSCSDALASRVLGFLRRESKTRVVLSWSSLQCGVRVGAGQREPRQWVARAPRSLAHRNRTTSSPRS